MSPITYLTPSPELPAPSPSRERAAAHKLTRFARKCLDNKAVSYLHQLQGVSSLIPLTHSQLRKFFTKAIPALRLRNLIPWGSLWTPMHVLSTSRRAHWRERLTPWFTSLGRWAPLQLPSFEFAPKSEAAVTFPGQLITDLETGFQVLEGRCEAHHPTKKELDALVAKIAACDLLAWEFCANGCAFRSLLITQMLELMGVPSDTIFRAYARVPSSNAIELPLITRPGKHKWLFHTAPCIRSAEGEECIIDPLFDPKATLTPEEWRARQVIHRRKAPEPWLTPPPVTAAEEESSDDLSPSPEHLYFTVPHKQMPLTAAAGLQLFPLSSHDVSVLTRGFFNIRMEIEEAWMREVTLRTDAPFSR